MICVPAGVTGVEQRAVQDAAEAAGARRPAHTSSPSRSRLPSGARIPVHAPQGHMIVDIGGGRAEAAVISMYGIVVTESVRVAGDRLDDAIAAYVKRRHNLIIGDRTAEELKIAIGSALPMEEEMTYQGARPRPDNRPSSHNHCQQRRHLCGDPGLPGGDHRRCPVRPRTHAARTRV